MVARCVVSGCTNSGNHVISKQENRRLFWIKAMNLEGQDLKFKHPLVCTLDFKGTDYTDVYIDLPEYPQGNENMMPFSTDAGVNNNTILQPDNVYYGGYSEFPMQRVNPGGFRGMSHGNASQFMPNNLVPGQGQIQVMSGIDPRYLAAYGDNNATYIVGQNQCHQNMQRERYSGGNIRPTFSNDQNIVSNNYSVPQPHSRSLVQAPTLPHSVEISKPSTSEINTGKPVQKSNIIQQKPSPAIAEPGKQAIKEVEMLKKEFQNPSRIRADKLRALHKSGPRVFSGPVEKVLKWHKILQEIGILVLYEIVAKCVSVRPGEACAKNLVVRDDSGPAMQVVYYEIDFLLPELTPSCTVRVVGRMMPGTCRLHAFNVRPATGDDMATLPRRAAVAAHHITKLSKEFGSNAI